MSTTTLEILIPTYRRPEAAIGAVDSVLAADDSRVRVFCHSNGVEPELEAAAGLRPSLRYGYFSENRGAVANFRKLLQDSDAQYVMLLSDEDRIAPRHLPGFVDFLSAHDHGFVFCTVVESKGSNYFSVSALHDETLTIADVLTLFTIDPTYMSGYCFRRSLLTGERIESAFENHEANVYPHLILRNTIAGLASVGVFAHGIVIKGAEANTGGDSHSHLAPKAGGTVPAIQRHLLNPRIYGESARARQLYYLLPKLDGHLAPLATLQRAYAKLYVLSAWLRMTCDAHRHVDPAAEVVTLEAALAEQRVRNQGRGIAWTYGQVLSIRSSAVRAFAVKLLWNLSKLIKLMLFIKRFGVSRTSAFVRGKHG